MSVIFRVDHGKKQLCKLSIMGISVGRRIICLSKKEIAYQPPISYLREIIARNPLCFTKLQNIMYVVEIG